MMGVVRSGLAIALVALVAGLSQAQTVPAVPAPPRPQPAAPAPSATPAPAAVVPLVGTVSEAMWRTYRSRFVTEDGRVVDTANGQISHSEGQGYGMLLAVAANDRGTFERIWGWTRANLMVRGDELLAWRWEPAKRPAVADMNNASDGDILVAWALVEAGEVWKDPSYRSAARRIATDIGRRVVLFKTGSEPLLIPGVGGFAAEDRSDGPVVNLSYWVFPAFPRLAIAAPEFDWDRVARTGYDLVRTARFGPQELPTEWISYKAGRPRPADGFAPVFSYNALRIPLYLVWSGADRPDLVAPFATLWGQRERAGLPVVDTTDGRVREWLDESGYMALASLLACAAAGTPLPPNFGTLRPDENYYPSTLHLLAVVAARTRYRTCFAG